MIMTIKRKRPDFGLPPPITKLTVEQDLRLRLLADKLSEDFHEHKEDITTLLLALQKQNFVLGNSLSNLVTKWSTLQQDALLLSLTNLERVE